MSEKVVVTGLGVISSLGSSVEEFWGNLASGKSGISPIISFDTTNFPVKVASEVKDFKPENYLQGKLADRTSRFTQFALAAASMAIKTAGLGLPLEDPQRVGVVISSCVDTGKIAREADILKTKGWRRIDPLLIAKIGPHMAAAHVGLLTGAKGPNLGVYTACSSGAEAIAAAFDKIRSGYADVMIAGGAEAAVDGLPLAGLAIVGALSREADPQKACRPFDLNRSGFVYGEGAAILILESESHAKKRRAKILAEIAGVGHSFDAYSETAPSAETQAMAMSMALKVAGVSPDDIDYINAHGTATRLNDVTETKAIKIALGERASKIPISSNKSMLGHIISAAGAIETIASIMTINHGIIPPTINYETPDPECDLDYVPNIARKTEVKTCLKNSFGMGGQNCCLVIKKFEG